LAGAADEVLATLKNEKMSSKEKKKETEAFLGPLAEERFALLLNLGKKITDFGHDPNAAKVSIIKFFIFFLMSRLKIRGVCDAGQVTS
jgi:hypothetical protein